MGRGGRSFLKKVLPPLPTSASLPFHPNNNLTAGNHALERTEHPLDAAGKHLRRKGIKPHGLTVDGDFNAPARGHAIAGRLLSSHDALRHGGTVRFPASSAIQRGQQKALLKNQIDQRIQIFGRERRQPGELVVPIRSERQLGAQSLAAFRKRRQKFRGGPQTQNTRQPADVFASFHQQDVRIQQRDQIPEEARMASPLPSFVLLNPTMVRFGPIKSAVSVSGLSSS